MTALYDPQPSLQVFLHLWISWQTEFLRGGTVNPCPNPNLEDQASVCVTRRQDDPAIPPYFLPQTLNFTIHPIIWLRLGCWQCRFIDLKLKLSHYTPRRRFGGEEVQLLLILKLGTRWGWVVSITPRPRFSPGERTPGTHCTGGWVGPRAGLEAEARGKILSPVPGIEHPTRGRPARSQTLFWLSYPAFCVGLSRKWKKYIKFSKGQRKIKYVTGIFICRLRTAVNTSVEK
jgi:hypothetical protein